MISSMLKLGYRLALALLLVLPVIPSSLFADEIAPALLQIIERESGWVDVTWKIPVKNNRGLGLTPLLPEFFKPAGPPTGRKWSGSWVEYSSYRTGNRALTGATIGVEGLGPIQTEVLVRITLKDGTQHSTILRPGRDSFTIPEQATWGEVIVSYWRMGTTHILGGADHLLFVLALLLIVTGLWPVLKAITSFTLAHSITLVLATLGIVNLPPAPTEAIISLSIVFLACEIIHKHQGKIVLTERYPWLIAFTFGLFHGLGFAGALSEIGVPHNEVPLALLMFNVGVETGQLLFIGAVLAVLSLIRRLPVQAPQGSWRLLPYSIGSIACFWTIERIISFL